MKSKKINGNRTTFSILNPNKNHAQFDYGEIYRHIRTSIEFSTLDTTLKSIAITSTQPFESKSTTALNLAIIFATKYERVLLIDCDLRKSQIHKYLKLSNKQGLTNALADYADKKTVNPDFFQHIQDSSFVGQLSILTAGIKVPNSAEVLGSDTYKNYLKDLKNYFDFIIVDCPPISLVSDAIPIGHAVDGTIFVCSAKDTNRKDAQAALSSLKQNKVNVLGSVLTKADTYGKLQGYYY